MISSPRRSSGINAIAYRRELARGCPCAENPKPVQARFTSRSQRASLLPSLLPLLRLSPDGILAGTAVDLFTVAAATYSLSVAITPI